MYLQQNPSRAGHVNTFYVCHCQSKKEFRTGGNAALMAGALAQLGCKVLLGGPVGPELRQLLDNRVGVCKNVLHVPAGMFALGCCDSVAFMLVIDISRSDV